MSHEVFISHAHEDEKTAWRICSAIEAAGIRCWVSQRDLSGGVSWGAGIIEAIESSKVLVALLSNAANESKHVCRELERAVNKRILVLPVRIEDVPPSKEIEYFISSHHWLDAFPTVEQPHLDHLIRDISRFLDNARSTQAPNDVGTGRGPSPRPAGSSRPFLTGATLVLVTCLATAATTWFVMQERRSGAGSDVQQLTAAPENQQPATQGDDQQPAAEANDQKPAEGHDDQQLVACRDELQEQIDEGRRQAEAAASDHRALRQALERANESLATREERISELEHHATMKMGERRWIRAKESIKLLDSTLVVEVERLDHNGIHFARLPDTGLPGALVKDEAVSFPCGLDTCWLTVTDVDAVAQRAMISLSDARATQASGPVEPSNEEPVFDVHTELDKCRRALEFCPIQAGERRWIAPEDGKIQFLDGNVSVTFWAFYSGSSGQGAKFLFEQRHMAPKQTLLMRGGHIPVQYKKSTYHLRLLDWNRQENRVFVGLDLVRR